MKKGIYILAIFTLALSLLSCSEKGIDKPEDIITYELNPLHRIGIRETAGKAEFYDKSPVKHSIR